MKKKTLFIVLAIILVLLIGIYPVIKKGNGDSKNNKITSSGSELTIYVLGMDQIQTEVVNKYKKINPNLKVVNFDDPEKYSSTISNDLLAGKGPDIIIGNENNIAKLNKLVDADVFLDINKLISEDKDFNLDDYNSAVMDAGVYDNKRLFIPYQFTTNISYGLKNVLQDNGINVTGDENLDELFKASEEYINKISSEDKDGGLFTTIYTPVYVGVGPCLDFEDLGFIDYKNKKVNFNNDTFKNILLNYKRLMDSACDEKIYEKYQYSTIDMLKDKKIMFDYDKLSITGTCSNQLLLQDMVDSEIVLLPNLYDRTASVTSYLAINANSKNQKGAYEFIKYMLSDEVQSDYDIIYQIPVNNAAVDKLLAFVEEDFSDAISSDNYAQLKNSILDVVKNTKKAYITDLTIEKIVYDAMDEYVSGKLTEDEVIKRIEEKMDLYINE